MYRSLYIIENGFGLLTILFYIFLIYLAFRIKDKGRDIKLIIGLALNEIFCLTSFQIDFVYYLTEGTPLIQKQIPCQIYGYIVSTAFYFEIMFNLILAIDIYHKIIQKELNSYIFLPLHINTIFCLSSIVWVSYNLLFEPAPGGLACMASLHKAIFSAFIYFYFVVGSTLGMLVIGIYYYKLASIIEHLQGLARKRVRRHRRIWKPINPSSFKKAKLRVYITIGIYILLKFSTGFLLINEGILGYYLSKDEEFYIIITQLPQITGILGSLANPVILLSLHTGISREFKRLMNKLM